MRREPFVPLTSLVNLMHRMNLMHLMHRIPSLPVLTRPRWRSLLRTCADRLLPGECALCGGDSPTPVCDRCSSSLRQFAGARCMRCAIRLPDHAVADRCCMRCLHEQPSYDRTITLTDYAPPLDRLLLDLKFRAQLPLAAVLGEMLGSAVAAITPDIAPATAPVTAPDISHRPKGLVLMAVPLSQARLTERGFNQAHEIARAVARVLNMPLTRDACARVRDTEAQASLTMHERQVNMRGAFAVLQRQAVAGNAILVVDDVMTTGHTLEAFAACLKRNGAVHVTNLVVARTPAR